MATYTGALAASGLPELADEGEVDLPAMTLRRALHVTLRDAGGREVAIPDPSTSPGSSPENPAYVAFPDGDLAHVKVDGGSIKPDLSGFPGGRLPVNPGVTPVTGSVAITNLPAPALPAPIPDPVGTYDNPVIIEQIDGDKHHVKVDNAVAPDLSRFPGGRMPVDTGLVIPPAAAPVAVPLPAPKPDPVGTEERPAVIEQLDGDRLHAKIDGGRIDTNAIPSLNTREAGVIVSTTAVQLAGINYSRLSILITNSGSGSLYVGKTSLVTASGSTVGRKVVADGAYFDSGPGRWLGPLWGIYSASAVAENVSVDECS